MSDHTPGPWVVNTWAEHMPQAGRASSVSVDDGDGCGDTICDIATEFCPDEEAWANAELIAKAPEMADEIRRLQAVVNNLRQERLYDEQERQRLVAASEKLRTELERRRKEWLASVNRGMEMNRELRALLRECQYSTAVYEGMYEDPTRECHCCYYPEESGKHAEGCRLAAALEETK